MNFQPYLPNDHSDDVRIAMDELLKYCSKLETKRLPNGQWCVRGAKPDEEQPLATIGKDLKAAANRLSMILAMAEPPQSNRDT